MKKIIHPSGAIEYVDTQEEKESKEKYKTKKKGSDLTDSEVRNLVYLLAKKENLI